MDAKVRDKLLAGGAIVVALLIGWEVAEGSLGLVAACAGLGLLFLLSWGARLAPEILLGGLVLVGYLVGNRGFAQLHPPSLPLLPAEIALGVALACGVWRWARTQTLPWRRDALNVAVLLWMVISAARLPVDARRDGIVAVRDFAMVYYALFFFIAQEWSASRGAARWLERCLVVGLAVGTPVFLAFLRWPDWFVLHLQIAGVPLIFVKSDVAGGFMAAGTLYFAGRFAQARRGWWLLLSAACLAATIASNSRAALVAFAVGVGWLVVARAWRTLQPLLAMFALGGLVLAAHAGLTDGPLTRTPAYRIYESVASMFDVRSARNYRSEDLGDKPDNNQFRLVWWRTVAADTWADGRWFGLGFGHDLASEFLRVYYADASEDFSARSPHNFLLSVFARTGIFGTAALLGVVAAMASKTRRAAQRDRRDGTQSLSFWLMGWAIFASACFGVVLEGPMGAVVFWTTLGLANASASSDAPAESGAAADPALQTAAPADELASAS